jgi:dipeptidase E
MPKLYLLGGENVARRSAREVNERAFQDAGQPLFVLVVPWARASFDNKYLRRKRLVDYFLSLGAYAVDFVEYSDSKQEVAKKMANSNLIYLTGGQVSILLERFRKAEIDTLLNKYPGVVIGRSAGALALCRKCLTTYRSNKKLKLVSGLSLFPFTVKVHYKAEKDEELENLSKHEKIYAIPEGSALVFDNGNISSIGKTYSFEKGKKSTL